MITVYLPEQSTLEFDLRLQEYIELARRGRKEDAIVHSKKHLISWQETHLAQIQSASTLLAFPPTTNCGPYKVSLFTCVVVIMPHSMPRLNAASI
jgi:hypothetical protein